MPLLKCRFATKNEGYTILDPQIVKFSQGTFCDVRNMCVNLLKMYGRFHRKLAPGNDFKSHMSIMSHVILFMKFVLGQKMLRVANNNSKLISDEKSKIFISKIFILKLIS